MSEVITDTEFITNKGNKAKLVFKPSKFGPSYQVMIEYEDGWQKVLAVIANKANTMSSIIERVKTNY